MFKDLGNKIILSLSYIDQFQYPLTKEEIFLRIIGKNNTFTLREVEKELVNLVSSGKLCSDKGFYSLEGSNSHVLTRLKRSKHSRRKWLEVEEFVSVVKHIPWIKAILVTGSLAVNNAKKNDDIDFLIIVKKNRLWIVRVLTVIFAFIKGKKRSWNGVDSNTWCLNLWLEDTSLKLPKRLRNIYGAFEISQAVWVFDRENSKNKFFELNSWAQEFLPNYFYFQKNNKAEIRSGKSKDYLFTGLFLNITNNILFFLQYLYMRPHMTTEKVEKNFAFFHPRDTKKLVLGQWIRKFKKAI